MAITINADTSNGLVMTPDTSGQIKLQAGGADIATVTSSGITMASGKTLPASALTGSLPAGMGGKILQVLQTVKNDTFTTTSTSFTDITGLSVTITPSSTSSKILVLCDVKTGPSSGFGVGTRLVRDATQIYGGTVAGVRPNVLSSQVQATTILASGGVYLDSPATTSATTYKIQILTSGGTAYVNRTDADRNNASYDARSASSILVMEIAG